MQGKTQALGTAAAWINGFKLPFCCMLKRLQQTAAEHTELHLSNSSTPLGWGALFLPVHCPSPQGQLSSAPLQPPPTPPAAQPPLRACAGCALLLKAPRGGRRAAPVIEQGLRSGTAAWPAVPCEGTPPGQRQCGERTAHKEAGRHIRGTTQLYWPRRSSFGPCKTQSEKERLHERCDAAVPRDARQPGRSDIGLLHPYQKSNTRLETSAPPSPSQPTPTAGGTDRQQHSPPRAAPTERPSSCLVPPYNAPIAPRPALARLGQ